MIDLDAIRARYPKLGLGLFAMEPGGPVTLETYVDSEVFSFRGRTVAEALAKAFPEAAEEPQPEPPNDVFG